VYIGQQIIPVVINASSLYIYNLCLYDFCRNGSAETKLLCLLPFPKNGSDLKYPIIGIPPLLHVWHNTVRHNKYNTHITQHLLCLSFRPKAITCTAWKFFDNELKKMKGLPQQAEVTQGVPGKLRPRIFLIFRHYKGGRSSAKRTGRLYRRRNP